MNLVYSQYEKIQFEMVKTKFNYEMEETLVVLGTPETCWLLKSQQEQTVITSCLHVHSIANIWESVYLVATYIHPSWYFSILLNRQSKISLTRAQVTVWLPTYWESGIAITTTS